MKDEYLGDGVYASFDGHQIWLAVNHHSNKAVALEPLVFQQLVKYALFCGPEYKLAITLEIEGIIKTRVIEEALKDYRNESKRTGPESE